MTKQTLTVLVNQTDLVDGFRVYKINDDPLIPIKSKPNHYLIYIIKESSDSYISLEVDLIKINIAKLNGMILDRLVILKREQYKFNLFED